MKLFPIRFGKLNKWHFCILATVTMKILDALICGISPGSEIPGKKISLLDNKEPIFNKHPFIKSSYSFMGIFILGLIVYIIKKIVEKKIKKEEGLLENKKEINNSERSSGRGVIKDYNPEAESLTQTILVIFIFVFAISSLTIYDSLRFNELKFWPLEYLIIYFFLKKILHRELYKHQNLAIISILVICDIGCLISSLIYNREPNCDNSENIENCLLLYKNSYSTISYKLGFKFIPIIIILYLISMTANSYGMVKVKYLIDFKFFETYKILMMLGIFGFLISILSAIVFNFIPCCKDGDNIHIQDICKLKDGNKYYLDSLSIYFKDLVKPGNSFFEFVVALPIFQVVNSLQSLFNLLIIKQLDPFYLIPIRCLYYIIHGRMQFITIENSSTLLKTKYALQDFSNLFAIICSLVYLEIIILDCHNFGKDVKEEIVERGKVDIEIANAKEEPSKFEIEIDDNYITEF